MVVRLVAVISIVMGILIWQGSGLQLLGAHIGLGFLVTLCLLVLGIIALMRRQTALGIVGIVLALLLPYAGFKQFPLAFGTFGLAQIAHVIVVLAALGVAESLNGRIQRAA